MKTRQSAPDLANMTEAADFWQTSLNELDAWETMRLQCKAEEDARREVKP